MRNEPPHRVLKRILAGQVLDLLNHERREKTSRN